MITYVLGYEVEIKWNDEDDCYIATVKDFPFAATYGSTIDEAKAMVKETIEATIEHKNVNDK